MFSSSRKSSKNHQLCTLQGLSERANEAQTDTIQRSIRQSTQQQPEHQSDHHSLQKQQEQSLQGGKPTTKYHPDHTVCAFNAISNVVQTAQKDASDPEGEDNN